MVLFGRQVPGVGIQGPSCYLGVKIASNRSTRHLSTFGDGFFNAKRYGRQFLMEFFAQ